MRDRLSVPEIVPVPLICVCVLAGFGGLAWLIWTKPLTGILLAMIPVALFSRYFVLNSWFEVLVQVVILAIAAILLIPDRSSTPPEKSEDGTVQKETNRRR